VSNEVFFKMSGSGNDFVFLDGRWTAAEDWPSERIRRVCSRRTGVGADGLVILSPGSEAGAVRFLFFNSDGSRGAMCGNAALCATRLAVELELARPEAVRLETDAGLVQSRSVQGSAERAELLLPAVTQVRFPEIEPGPGERKLGFALVGVPHLVVVVDDLESADVPRRGRALRFHRLLEPDGANVNFVARQGDGWAMRTYERGVEDETLACGTGAVACGVILGSLGEATLPWNVRTRSGTTLIVSGRLVPGRRLEEPSLGGEGRLVYRGALGPEF
jgi:diaminopimelate epimerase